MKLGSVILLLLVITHMEGSDRKKSRKILSRTQYLEQSARQREKIKKSQEQKQQAERITWRQQEQFFHELRTRNEAAQARFRPSIPNESAEHTQQHKEPNCLKKSLRMLTNCLGLSLCILGPDASAFIIMGGLLKLTGNYPTSNTTFSLNKTRC